MHVFTPAVLALVPAALDELEGLLKPKGVYEQRRVRSLAGDAPPPAELIRGAAAPVELEVNEGPLRFWVDVTAPLSTGLFLDLRACRTIVISSPRCWESSHPVGSWRRRPPRTRSRTRSSTASSPTVRRVPTPACVCSALLVAARLLREPSFPRRWMPEIRNRGARLTAS